MVISDQLDYGDVFAALQAMEAQIGITINPNVLSFEDWRCKRNETGFIARIAAQFRLFVIGSDDDLC